MIELTEEEYEKFMSLGSKRKSFWSGEKILMSDRARWLVSTPQLAEKLAEEIRKQRRNK